MNAPAHLWLGAAQGKRGRNTRVDQKGGSWSCQSTVFPRTADLGMVSSHHHRGWGHLILSPRSLVKSLLTTGQLSVLGRRIQPS